MAGRIYLPGGLRGRLGNQLFKVNMALQLSVFFDARVSIPFTKYTKLFKLPSFRVVSCKKLEANNNLILRCNDFVSRDKSDLLLKIGERLQIGNDVTIPPDLLGEGFETYSFLHPRELISLKKYRDYGYLANSVALHFRGTDFLEWNPVALMNADFYMESIYTLGLSHLDINIFSDDLESTTVRHLVKYLPKSRIFPKSSLANTFSALSQHGHIIASPSTFSLWAALLGSPSSLTISRKWIDAMVNAGDNFWPLMAENKNSYIHKINIV